jgi:hypothetical protein
MSRFYIHRGLLCFLQIMLYWSAPLTLGFCMSSEHLQATLSNSLDDVLDSGWLETWQSLCFWPNCIVTAVTSPSLHSAYLPEFWGYGASILNLWKDLHLLEVSWDHLVSLCPDPTLLPPKLCWPIPPASRYIQCFPHIHWCLVSYYRCPISSGMPADATVSICFHPPKTELLIDRLFLILDPPNF